MMKTSFLTIFCSFENQAVVEETLPSIIRETRDQDARLIVHDSSVRDRDRKWAYLRELNREGDFFLLLSDNLSMAHARNMCLHLGQEMYAPEYICMVEDDHGYHPGFISAMTAAMLGYYGKTAPNQLRFGLFTGCREHNPRNRAAVEEGHTYPKPDSPPKHMGKANSCCRCAPTAHWNNVLKGYDTDEYPISLFQTANLNLRNYHKGFTSMVVGDGRHMFSVPNQGRGTSSAAGDRLWNDEYAASDPRSRA